MILNHNSWLKKVLDVLEVAMTMIRLQRKTTLGGVCAISALLLTFHYFFVSDASFRSKR
jgi:hypothetical protein